MTRVDVYLFAIGFLCATTQPQATRGDGLLQGELDTNILYFSRTKGLFRICFEDKKVPKGGQSIQIICPMLCLLQFDAPADELRFAGNRSTFQLVDRMTR